MTSYYFQPLDRVYSAQEIQNLTGLIVSENTYGYELLNAAGVYEVTTTAVPYDERLYDLSLSYVITGTNAVQTWAKADKDLAATKLVAKEIMIEKYEADAKAAAGDYGPLVLLAIAAKTAASRSASEVAIIDALKTVATSLSDDLATIDAAADVDAIDAVVNP
jgi:hypothetical protein